MINDRCNFHRGSSSLFFFRMWPQDIHPGPIARPRISGQGSIPSVSGLRHSPSEMRKQRAFSGDALVGYYEGSDVGGPNSEWLHTGFASDGILEFRGSGDLYVPPLLR
jgi:hypothetical protein